MKAEAIQEAFSLASEVDRDNTVMTQARAELKALEESHAGMVLVLLDVVNDGVLTPTNPLYYRIRDALSEAGIP